eukprot:TRINITY_DN1231_c0_g2_i5.p3 TRINITY_DN1231_c0_g2~~TRINITY_DN1231_c0_g2_i5.p3  ORF type:complete len:119 (+),score=41.96 TRINITY_DN1231_c0_g2_i5:501-857(+)
MWRVVGSMMRMKRMRVRETTVTAREEAGRMERRTVWRDERRHPVRRMSKGENGLERRRNDVVAATDVDNGVEEVEGGTDEKEGEEEKEGGEDGAKGEDTGAPGEKTKRKTISSWHGSF